MNDLMRIATVELARFLAGKLPEVSADWWQKHVYDRLSSQQQRVMEERGQRTLQHLDLAALLRVLDQNWFELSQTTRLPREGRSWVKELQAVRNKRAHLSAEALPASETYRDADTLGRLLKMIGAEQASLDLAEEVKAAAAPPSLPALLGGFFKACKLEDSFPVLFIDEANVAFAASRLGGCGLFHKP